MYFDFIICKGGTSASYVQQADGSKYAKVNSEGYMDGGLGDGVTAISEPQWSNFNGLRPFVPCGITNVLGNRTGTVPYAIKGASDETIANVQVPSYRGIENPFGHIWKWTEGAKVVTSSGVGKFYVSEDLTQQTLTDGNTNINNYRYVGDLPDYNGYVRNILGGEYGDIAPSEIGGSATSFFYDYFYQNASTVHVVALGGRMNDKDRCGLSCVDTYYTPLNHRLFCGSRLCFQNQ